jgi:hypothetical protein
VTFNSWLGGAIHGLPALVNFLSIELLTGQLKNTVRRRGVATTLSVMESAVTRARQELADLEKRADAMTQSDATLQDDAALSPVMPPMSPVSPASKIGRDVFVTTYRNNGHSSVAELARALGVDTRTAQRWVRADA